MRLGDGNLSDNVGIQRRLILRYDIHPQYQEGQPYYSYDVAVLTLDPPADISGQYVRPICIPTLSSLTSMNLMATKWTLQVNYARNLVPQSQDGQIQ